MRKTRGREWNRKKDTLNNPLPWLLTTTPKKNGIGRNSFQTDDLIDITTQNWETTDDLSPYRLDHEQMKNFEYVNDN